MQKDKKLIILYDELSKHDLLSDFKSHNEIVCYIKQSHEKVLKKLWDKYGRYTKAHSENPSKLKSFFLAMTWLFAQAYLDLRYEQLSRLTELYISAAGQLKPVQFSEKDRFVAVHFRKK